MAGSLTVEAPADDRLLGVPREQRAVDRLGLARRRLRADHAAALPRGTEHPRRVQERSGARRQGGGGRRARLPRRQPGLAMSAAPGAASPAGRTTRMLFVGNSYTARHDLPALVAQLGAEAVPPVPIETQAITAGGASLRRHW